MLLILLVESDSTENEFKCELELERQLAARKLQAKKSGCQFYTVGGNMPG
jgi:hypothetical protein